LTGGRYSGVILVIKVQIGTLQNGSRCRQVVGKGAKTRIGPGVKNPN